MSEFHWLSLICGVHVLDSVSQSWDIYPTTEMCILIASLTSNKCAAITLYIYYLPLKGDSDGEVKKQVCEIFMEQGG